MKVPVALSLELPLALGKLAVLDFDAKLYGDLERALLEFP